MGLDNGIEVRRTPETNKIAELKVFNKDWDKELRYDFEICYWRKCWNIRNDILYILDTPLESNCYEWRVNKDNVDEIIKLLSSYNEDNWEDSGSSIWEWTSEEEGWPYSEYVKQNIEDLKLLRQIMNEYELEVYFYDSY